jgi:hypothetical protein
VADAVGLDVGEGVDVKRVAVGVRVGVKVLVGVAVGPAGGGFDTVPQSAGQLVFVSPV